MVRSSSLHSEDGMRSATRKGERLLDRVSGKYLFLSHQHYDMVARVGALSLSLDPSSHTKVLEQWMSWKDRVSSGFVLRVFYLVCVVRIPPFRTNFDTKIDFCELRANGRREDLTGAINTIYRPHRTSVDNIF